MLLMMVLVSEWEILIPQLLFEQLLLMSVLSLLYEKSIPWSLFEQVVFVKTLPWELLRWMATRTKPDSIMIVRTVIVHQNIIAGR